MNGELDRSDALVDQNLRQFARRVELPAAPTAEQRASWKLADGGAVRAADVRRSTILSRGVSLMKRYRIFTLASTAAAAAMLFVAFLLYPGGQAVVQAKTILSSLKSTQHAGIRLTCENIHDPGEGVRVNASIVIEFERPVSLAELVDSIENGVPPLRALYADVLAKFDESSDELPGATVVAKASLSKAEKWVFARIRPFPEKLIEDEPMLMLVRGVLEGGILLELDGLDEYVPDVMEELFDDIVDPELTEAAAGGKAVQLAVEVNPAGEVEVTPKVQTQVETQIRTGVREEVRLEVGDEATAQLFKALLTGRADRAQLDAVVAMIEQEAGSVLVKELGDGRYVLSASGFADDEELKDAVIEISYRQGAGVERVDVRNFAGGGTARIEFIGEVADADRISKAALLSDGEARVLNAKALMQLVESLGGGGAGEPK